MVGGHGLVVAPLGAAELVVGAFELGDLGGFVGEGLGGAHAGEGGLQLAVDAGQLLLHLQGGLAHPPALEDGENEEEGHHGEDDEGQLPADGEHDAEGAQQGDGGDEEVLGAVVGQLGDLKEVTGDPAHELAGAVFVVEGEGQVLHVGKEGRADVGLDAHAQQVSPVGDDVGEHRLEEVGRQQGGHHQEEGLVEALGEGGLQHLPGHRGEQQVHQADAQGTGHVQQEDGQVWLVIGGKNAQVAAAPHLFRRHICRPLSSMGCKGRSSICPFSGSCQPRRPLQGTAHRI